MATVDKLVVRIEADMKQLKTQLRGAGKATQNTATRMKKSFSQIGTSAGRLRNSIFSIQGALIGLGVGAGIKSLISVGNSVESLQIRFKTLFGSAQEGSKAFEVMAQFAGQVPFSLKEIQAGSGSLLAVADDAEHLGELLEMTGTIAAATGLDFNTASQQIQRSLSAGINSADLFRDRGVTAMLGFSAGTETSVKETKEALEKFARENKGITDELAGTFAGTLSMIGDTIFTFQRQINDAGFFAELTSHFANLKAQLDGNAEGMEDLAKNISDKLVRAMEAITEAIKFVARNTDELILAFKIFIGLRLASAILPALIGAFGLLKIAIKGVTKAVLFLNTATKANIFMAGASIAIGAVLLLLGRTKDSLAEVEEGFTKLSKRAVDETNKQIAVLRKEIEFEQERMALNNKVANIGSGDAQAKENKLTEASIAMKEAEIKLLQEKLGLQVFTPQNDIDYAVGNQSSKDKRDLLNSSKLSKEKILENKQLEFMKKIIAEETEKLKIMEMTAAQEQLFNILKKAEVELTKEQKADLLKTLEITHGIVAGKKLQEAEDKKNAKILEEVTSKTTELKDANALLQAEVDGANETQILQLAIAQQNTGATNEQVLALQALIAEQQRLKGLLVAEEEEKEKKAEDDQAVLDLVDDLGLLDNAQQDYQDSVDMLDVALADNLITMEQYREGLGKLKMTLLESTEEGKLAIEGFERVQDLLFDSMADALTGAEEGWKGFRDSLKGIVKDIIAQYLKLQAQQAITKMMGGGGSGGGGFGLGDILSFGSSFFGGGGSGGFNPNSSGGQGNIFGFANGGSVNPNTPSLVGEKGPELFVPHTSGGIFTNRSLKNSGGGGATVNQTINIETGVSQTVRAEMISLLPQIKQESVSAVMDAKKRGGQMADTFS